MAAWQGGPCPDCGDDMPPNMLRCMTCRAWLNPELTRPEPTVPDLFDLPEIEPGQVTRLSEAAGHYVVCPECQKELRIASNYFGQRVGCKFCQHPFELSFDDPKLRRVGVYVSCPHCQEELRAARKYLGNEVVCRFCSGSILLPEPDTSTSSD